MVMLRRSVDRKTVGPQAATLQAFTPQAATPQPATLLHYIFATMKLPIRSLPVLGLFFAMLISSCGTVTEEFWVNADGTGRYEMRYDASEMFGMLAMMDAASDEENDSEGEETTDDAIDPEDPEAAMRNMMKQERIDTLVSFSEILPDSVMQQVNDRRALRQALEAQGTTVTELTLDSVQNAVASLQQLSMMFNMDKQAEQLKFGMRVNFDRPADVADIFGSMSALQSLGGQQSPGGGMASKMNNSTTYELEGNILKIRQAENASLDEFMKMIEEQGKDDVDEEELMQTLDMLGLGSHDVIVHVPGKIKSVSGAEYQKLDDNTLKFKLDYVSVLKGGDPLAVDVKFKKKRKFRKVLLE